MSRILHFKFFFFFVLFLINEGDSLLETKRNETGKKMNKIMKKAESKSKQLSRLELTFLIYNNNSNACCLSLTQLELVFIPVLILCSTTRGTSVYCAVPRRKTWAKCPESDVSIKAELTNSAGRSLFSSANGSTLPKLIWTRYSTQRNHLMITIKQW